MDIVLYLAAILAMVFSLWAQFKVQSTFNRYSRVNTASGGTAAQVAEMILHSSGVYDVRIERVAGNLTDHYDPRSNTLRLSDGVYASTSAAAIGVAAHEAGHAIQHAEGYLPIKIRSMLVPVTNFASRMAWLVIMLGILMMSFAGDTGLGYYVTLIGIALFAVTALFQLVTLPCEFNASSRAMEALSTSGRYTYPELAASRKVLTAAALTYVAALVVSVIQLLRLLTLLNRNDRR
jgi:Zn-dependent membrane protease YugP